MISANAAIKVSRVQKGMKKLKVKGAPNMNKTLNLVRQFRKRTRQSKQKQFSRNFKGKVIDGVHELYTLTAGMMLGIRGIVGYTTSFKSLELTIDDFNHVEKRTFPAKGCNKPPHITPPHALVHTFKFKSYAPKVFSRIRDLFDIDISSYTSSVCGENICYEVTSMFVDLFTYSQGISTI